MAQPKDGMPLKFEGFYSAHVGMDLLSRSDGLLFHDAAAVAAERAYMFDHVGALFSQNPKDRIIRYEVQTQGGLTAVAFDWGAVKFVPSVELGLACDSSRSRRSLGATHLLSGVPGAALPIEINPDEVKGRPIAVIPAIILHEWAHASLNQYISRTVGMHRVDELGWSYNMDQTAARNPRTRMVLGGQETIQVSHLIVWEVTFRMFPETWPLLKGNFGSSFYYRRAQ